MVLGMPTPATSSKGQQKNRCHCFPKSRAASGIYGFNTKTTPPNSQEAFHCYLLFGRFRLRSSPVVNSTSSELVFIGFFVLLFRWALALPSFVLPIATHLLS
jgi:hypothetical protein